MTDELITKHYYVEFTQQDPADSPTPATWHYAGEVNGLASATEALVVGLRHIGGLVPEQYFYPCCDWQKRTTPIVGVVVYYEDEHGNRNEEWSIQARLKKELVA